MTRLVIGMESIEIKTAKKKVLSNLKILHSQIKALHRNPAVCGYMYTFYSKKIDEQTAILDWLNQYKQKEVPRSVLAVCV